MLGEIGSQSVEIYVRLSDLCGARYGENGLASHPQEDLAVVWSTSRSLHDALHKCQIQRDVYRTEATEFAAAAAAATRL